MLPVREVLAHARSGDLTHHEWGHDGHGGPIILDDFDLEDVLYAFDEMDEAEVPCRVWGDLRAYIRGGRGWNEYREITVTVSPHETAMFVIRRPQP